MSPGDVFIYQGPAWDIDAGGPEFFDTGNARLEAVEVYKDFIIAVEPEWRDARYVIPAVFIKTGEEVL